jgi:hypothetical protein
MEYEDLTNAQQEDLFARVQKGVILTPAEKMKATTGVWQEFALEIERSFPDILERKNRPIPSLLHLLDR